MARLTISLLGSPRIEVDGVPIAVDTRKAVALLAYLAVTGERKSRDTLASFLWPDYDSEHARAALRRTLSALGKGLGGEFLEIDRTAIALDPADAWLDVADFRRLAAEGQDAEAAELYRGDFLAGFGLRDSLEFDDWQFFEAETLKRDFAGVLERIARVEATAGRFDGAVELTRRWLALDELQEPAHRLLMELYARSGQRSAALRAYQECVRVLESELGVAPLEETAELAEAIKANAVPVVLPRPTTPLAPESPGSPAPPGLPLVGREAERRALGDALAASASHGRVVIVEGEAGIGKTRLVEELAERAAGAGVATAVARCSETESTLPYGVVADAIRDALAGSSAPGLLASLPSHWRGEAARLVPELGEGPPAADGPGARTRFIDGLDRTLGALAGLVVVDDAHWIDEGSLDVLAHLARRLHDRSLCLVLTWRPEDLPAGHGLERLVADAQRERTLTTVRLARLSRDDVAELATVAGASDLSERLFEESDGLPLFVVEYLAATADLEAGEWKVPSTVAGLLSARVDTAGETGQQVLTAAAVLGRAFDLDTVREVSGRSEEEVVVALEELAGRRLVGEVPEGYDFAHSRMRELVYGKTSLARRRLLHRRAAEALAARERRNPGEQAAVIAEHFRMAGRESDAAAYFAVAGERARTLYANVDAVGHLRSALALGHGEPAMLQEGIGDVLVLLADYDAALESYEAAAASAPADHLAALERKLGTTYLRRGDWEVAAAHFEAASVGLDDPAERSRLFADRSLNEHRRGNEQPALELADEALQLAEQAGDDAALAQAHNILGVLASSRDDAGEARRHLQTSIALADALPDPAARVAALNNLALVERTAGNLDDALGLTEQALDLCASQGDRHREAALHNNLADILHAAGREQEAMEHLKLAVSVLAEIGGSPDETPPGIWTLVEW